MFDVTIVGAGFCGTMTAVQLLRTARDPLRIRLIEKNPSQLGRGVAYSTAEHCHLLNVPAGRMSAIPEDPDHFFRWAAAHSEQIRRCGWPGQITRNAYLPRKYYGDYLVELLRNAVARSDRHKVELVMDEVAQLDFPTNKSVGVRTGRGSYWRSDACVLALGNTAPVTPEEWCTDTLPAGSYHANPWATDVLPRLLHSDSCLLLGSGLTMMDVVMALDGQHYRGIIHVVSRRGLIPLAHAPDSAGGRAALPPAEVLEDKPCVRALLMQLRRLSRDAGPTDADWQAVVDAIRPHTPSLWLRLDTAQQRRFLRHVRPYWDHHRHRVAPIVRQRFNELAKSGRVRVHAGRVTHTKHRASFTAAIDVWLQTRRDAAQTLSVDQLVNCTGPGITQSGCNRALLQTLLGAYPTAQDSLRLGVTVTPDMRLSAGERSPYVFVLGPPVKGHLWESTAVPECRAAINRIAAGITSLASEGQRVFA